MAPLLVLAGIVLLSVALVLVRATGGSYRIGRTLAAAMELSLTDAIKEAVDGRTSGYLRTTGRISSEEEFPDENDRPLVFRRKRLQARAGREWRTIEDERTAVPFGIEERGTYLAVDIDALGDGLVVVPREATGVASDLPEGTLAPGQALSPATPVRLRIDQLSAVEHATVAGVVRPGADGQPHITAGADRPLIVTSLAPAEAMRVLAAEHRGGVRLASVLLVAGLATIAAGLVAVVVGL
ncbi:MAG: hypothetical protein ABWZ82_06395 [Candidatus Limnocylindrales bacterium]